MKNKLKEMKGITLIALVITIIVLLILAGVSIATLTGENGILTQATNAKQETKQAEADEMFKLIANEWQIEKRKTGARDLEIFLAEEAAEYGVRVEDGNVLVYNGEKVQIDNNGTLTEVTEEEEPAVLAAGLYGEDGTMTYSWDELISNGYLIVNNGELIADASSGEREEAPENGDAPANLVGKLVIDSSVTSFSREALYGCNNLTEIVVPNSITSLGDYGTFMYCTNLKSVTLLNGVKSIGECCFYGCSNLTKIIIPDSVTSIGDSAFHWCESLTEIAIPDSVINICDNIFGYDDGFDWGCNNLTTVYYSGTARLAPWGAPNATIKPYNEAPAELLP